MNEVSVEAENLRREFKTKEKPVVALEDVSLSVKSGEVFGVLGPNGAGKTTLIRILSTLLLPTGGSAKVMGFDVATEPEKVRRVINMASGAEKAGYDFISARTNLWFFSQLYGIPAEEANRRIDALAGELGLSDYLDRKFYALSTGYRQRATTARAFVNEPRVVFLDEPTIGLDVMTALSIREFLKSQARREGRTLILATHNMAEVESICDRVAIVDRGRVIASGTPDQLKRSFGAPALVLEVQPIPKSLGMLEKVPGVKGFTMAGDEERGLANVEVVVASEESAKGCVDALEEQGFRVLTSWRKQASLEEVFVALVGQGFRERERDGS